MARDFLPTPSTGAAYPVAPANGDFFGADSKLLSHIGANMSVAEAQTEGRVPSPLSRAYMFYTALFGTSLVMAGNDAPALGADGRPEDKLRTEGRAVLAARARETFRGLCAVFALREALNLDIALRRIPLAAAQDNVSRVLVPNLNGAPGGAGFWQSMRIFTVREAGAEHAKAEVFAGLSPLTAFFPAANPPDRALAGVFWYEAPTPLRPSGLWHDPTSDRPAGAGVTLAPAARNAVRAALSQWVAHVLNGYNAAGLEALGVTQRGTQMLKAELEAWQRDLSGAVAVEGITVEDGAIAADPGATAPAFLSTVCRGVGGAVLSDLPLHHGQLVVSSVALADATLRIWGRRFGDKDLRERAAALPRKGPNLGAALGLGETAAPVPFVCLDKMFTPKLTVLTQKGISDEWRALPVEYVGSTDYALFPFHSEILELLTPDELVASATAGLSQDQLKYIVRLRVGTQEVTQLYNASGEGDYAFDTSVLTDTADIRLFPNFDVTAVGTVLSASDATYHARVRLGPTWDFRIEALRIATESETGADGQPLGPVKRTAAPFGTVVRRGSTLAADPPGAYPPGEAAFYTLDAAPDAFQFQDRGLCLVQLRPPMAAQQHPQAWDVAVDFGTSNTCVTWRPTGGEGTPSPFEFPVLTTTLLQSPVYGALEPVNEGGAAAADFFYKLSESDRDLLAPTGFDGAAHTYFPTQILTQQSSLPDQGSGDFDLAAGLILFQNANLSGYSLLQITEGFDLQREGRPLTKRFKLKQDLKWSQQDWLRVFMSHLRLQVVLSAARQNARVDKVHFSYPKAFSGPKRIAYFNALDTVWGELMGETASESEAVRKTLAGEANQHVVFDIGGGTADVIGFDSGKAAFQSSFQLAARQINGYVVDAPALRSAFIKALDAAGLKGQFGATIEMFRTGSESQLLNTWVGLLQSIEYDDPRGKKLAAVMSELATSSARTDAEEKAVRGFLLSIVLMFGGLAYYGGRLLGLAADGQFGTTGKPGRAFPLTQVQLTLTGNGSKLYRLISSDFAPFGRIIEHLFQKGLAVRRADAADTKIVFKGIYEIDGVPSPKTTVALGLLDTTGADEPVPVANVVGEVVKGPDGEAGASHSLVDFYRRLKADAAAFTPPTEAPGELAAFLDALREVMPHGRYGFDTSFVVVPGLSENWHQDLKTSVYRDARGALLDRLRANTADLPDGASGESAYVPALEPVFVAELVALMEQIKEDAVGTRYA